MDTSNIFKRRCVTVTILLPDVKVYSQPLSVMLRGAIAICNAAEPDQCGPDMLYGVLPVTMEQGTATPSSSSLNGITNCCTALTYKKLGNHRQLQHRNRSLFDSLRTAPRMRCACGDVDGPFCYSICLRFNCVCAASALQMRCGEWMAISTHQNNGSDITVSVICEDGCHFRGGSRGGPGGSGPPLLRS